MRFVCKDQQLTRFQELLFGSPSFSSWMLSEREVELLTNYYGLVLKWSKILPLTTVIEPSQFIKRHIYESLFINDCLLPLITSIWDLGSGVGIPGLVLAILRPNIEVILVDMQKKKSIFLQEVVDTLQLINVRVENSRIEKLSLLPLNSSITARAVERMTEMIPCFFQIGQQSSQFLLLGGGGLFSVIYSQLPKNMCLKVSNIPESESRFLFSITSST